MFSLGFREYFTEDAIRHLSILEYLARETVEIELRKNPQAAFDRLDISMSSDDVIVDIDPGKRGYGSWLHRSTGQRGQSLVDLLTLLLGFDTIRGFFRIAAKLNIDTSPEALFFQGCDPGWYEYRSCADVVEFTKHAKSYY